VSGELRVACVVAARDEACVIERKLRNLARIDWPASPARPHMLVVVDDGSRDSTAALARQWAAHAEVNALVRVLENRGPAGKSGAIRWALGVLERENESFDLVVLSDADVILDRAALTALVKAFRTQPRLGVACGSQTFVHALANSGSVLGPGGESPARAGEFYDRLTAWVRAVESRAGRLFSVHGQLCAWRFGQGFEPPTGLAADDIELGLRARSGGWRVARVGDARFFEEKKRGREGALQAERRALAYFQLVRRRRRPPGGSWIDSVQWWLYRTLPPAAPFAFVLALVAGVCVSTLSYGLAGFVASGAAVALALRLSPGRTLLRRLAVIVKAQRAPLELSDRWDTLRSGAGVPEGP